VNRSNSQKERLHEQRTESKPYEVGMQISSHMDTEIPQERTVWDLRKYLGDVLRELARRKECEILEGHLMADHAIC